ncbi:MAG: hypothetical protein K8S98_18280 [Planctomycetes bacterium]|nr:hypothetical protein [Planctomycetota bacterium]
MLISFLLCTAFAGPSQSATTEPTLQEEQTTEAVAGVAYPPALVHDIVVIVRQARDPKSPERERLAAALVKLGTIAIDPLLDLLERKRVPVLHEGQTPQTLSLYQREVLLAALRELGPERVLGRLDRRLAERVDANRRLAALTLFGEFGRREQLTKLFELAAPAAGEPLDRDLRDALRAALGAILAREPLAVPRLAATWRSIDVALLSTVIFTLGDVHDGRGLELASDVAFVHPDLLPVVAAQVAVIGRSPDSSVNQHAIELLRASRANASPSLGAAVVRALGMLEDEESIQDWIDLLADESEALRSAAHWSLMHVSRLEYAETPDAWQVWWDSEAAWLDEHYEPLLERLDSADASVVTAALRELANRRVRRHEIAKEVARVLQSPRPALRVLACQTLIELGSVDVLTELSLALRDDDEQVALAAWRALEALSGRSLPADSLEWDELVVSREP